MKKSLKGKLKLYSLELNQDVKIKLTVNNAGHIINAEGFNFILWTTEPQTIDEILKGKHIQELSNMLHEYGIYRNVTNSFDQKVLNPKKSIFQKVLSLKK